MRLKPKCRRCVPKDGPGTRIITEHGSWWVRYCRICRRALSPLDLMRPRLELVPKAEGTR